MSARLPLCDVNFTAPEFLADPYPAYARLRDERPVCWDEKFGHWVVSRYEDVHFLLRDKRWSSNQLDELMGRLSADDQSAAGPLRDILTNRLVLTDNPAHHRVRGLMQQAFTPRRVERMRAIIQSVADELIDRILPAGRAELIADFADPLPARVIATMLGLPPDDRHRFKTWTDDIYAFFGFSAVPVAERARRGTDSARQLRTYLADLFAAIRRSPRDDLLSGMVAAEEHGDRLTETELFSNVVGLINASHETTTNLIGNTILALLRHPEQWRRLADEPARAADAVEEGLRYDAPVQLVLRRAAEDIAVAGVTIPRGDRAVVALGSANRDPAVYTDPDRFEVARDEAKHVSFGGGPHFCLGTALGRLEGQLAIETAVRRLPRLRVAADRLDWRALPVFRGLRALPVEF
jgi:cytochrome P450